MKYYNIRVVIAKDKEKAIDKIEEGAFDEDDRLCDRVIEAFELLDELYPNGQECFLETFYEIVGAFYSNPNSKVLEEIENTKGRGGMWEYAQKLAHEFENDHRDTEWDGEFFDAMENFLSKKL